ncbi:MAG: winged helix-turn-helix domain-containing protein [Burkholderiales bacterium]
MKKPRMPAKPETKTAAAEPAATPDEYRFGRLRIVLPSRAVYLGNEEVFFTTTDFDLLWFLASHAGKVLSREDILAGLGGIADENPGRLIDMRISRLRRRVGDDTENPRRIKTVRGKGYLFDPSEED